MNSCQLTTKFFLFLIIGLLLLESFLTPYEIRNPDEEKFPFEALATVEQTCRAYNNGKNIPDPTDCQRYYTCIFKDEDNAYEASCDPTYCGDEFHFDDSTKDCQLGKCSTVSCECSPQISCDGKVEGSYYKTCSCKGSWHCDGKGGPPTENLPCNSEEFFVEPLGCIPGCCSDANILLCPPTTTTSTSTSTTTTTSTSTSTSTSTLTSTSTSTSTPTLTTTGIISPCQSSFVCPSDGNFRNCNYCDRTYWHCYQGKSTLMNCALGTLFNSVEAYPFCLEASNCPWP